MKTVGMREAKQLLSAYVARAQHERVIIMKHGKPAAVVIGVEGQDLEDVLLAHDPPFWKLMHERREQPTVPLQEVRRRLGLSPAKKPRKTRMH